MPCEAMSVCGRTRLGHPGAERRACVLGELSAARQDNVARAPSSSGATGATQREVIAVAPRRGRGCRRRTRSTRAARPHRRPSGRASRSQGCRRALRRVPASVTTPSLTVTWATSAASRRVVRRTSPPMSSRIAASLRRKGLSKSLRLTIPTSCPASSVTGSRFTPLPCMVRGPGRNRQPWQPVGKGGFLKTRKDTGRRRRQTVHRAIRIRAKQTSPSSPCVPARSPERRTARSAPPVIRHRVRERGVEPPHTRERRWPLWRGPWW